MLRSDSAVTDIASFNSDDEYIGPSSPIDAPHPLRVDPTSDDGSNIRAQYSPTTVFPDVVRHSSPEPLPDENEPNEPSPSSSKPGVATARLRASVMKVIQMHKSSSKFTGSFHQPGAEPGIDPRRPSAIEHYAHIYEDCKVQIIDYSGVQASFVKADNQGLLRFLKSPRTNKPSWAKVRWINVGGVSWDIISALALKYELHPLSIEDVLHNHPTTLSKADYYVKHLFISTLCHSLRSPPRKCADDNELLAGSQDPEYVFPAKGMAGSSGHGVNELPTPVTTAAANCTQSSWLPFRFIGFLGHKSSAAKVDEESIIEEKLPKDELDWITDSITSPPPPHTSAKETGTPISQASTQSPEPPVFSTSQEKVAARLAFVNDLKKGSRVDVDIRNLYLFLLRDGTVISFYKKDEHASVFGIPIMHRLRESHTLLRSSADPSLLLQAILDYVVDDAMQVVDRYHEQILGLERQVLIKPKMSSVRDLHILSGDLKLHKRTLTPMRSLVYGLRRYDLDRCKALIGSYAPGTTSENVKGFMTHQSKVYLADVVDHMDYILSSMDMFASIAENLITFTFNTISYQTNETMRRLTLTTIIFFPLTFLTGYFGMNFEGGTFWAIRHSDLFFWEVAIPVMVTIIALFLWSDFVRFAHFVKKKMWQRKLQQKHKHK